MKILSDETKHQYRKQLKKDWGKDFESEFVRTTNLERFLVDEYQFEGIRFIFEDKNSANYFELGHFPKECPWIELNSKSIAMAIDELFSSISDVVPNLLQMLKERCKYLYVERNDDGWFLHYFLDILLYDGRPYFDVYSGGAPNQNPETNKSLLKYQWKIPEDLKRLYAIHDGFGPILSSKEIWVLSDIMDPICKEQNFYPEGYSFHDLIEFHPDGAGNGQCFFRSKDQMTTVDWDHETREISEEEDFFEYINWRLTELDEE